MITLTPSQGVVVDIVLVPGIWLHGSTWDGVTAVLERAGHRVQALTLPGVESRDADRSGVTLADHVSAVVVALDAANGPVLLVGHSAGSAIAHAAVDARPDRVARAVYVGGFRRRTGMRCLRGCRSRTARALVTTCAAAGPTRRSPALSLVALHGTVARGRDRTGP